MTTRTYPTIWDAYATLATDLTGEGRSRVFQADLVNAVLALHLPPSHEAAWKVLESYRQMLVVDPPRDLRAL